MPVTKEKINGSNDYTYVVNVYNKGKRSRKYYPTQPAAEAAERRLLSDTKKGLARLALLDDKTKLEILFAYERSVSGDYDLMRACMVFEDGHEVLEPIQVYPAREAFLAAKKKTGLGKETLKTYKASLRVFGAVFDMREIDTISTSEFEVWLDGQAYSPKRFNRQITDMTTFWNWLKKKKYRVGKENPFIAVEQNKGPGTKKKEASVLQVNQVLPLLAAAVSVKNCGAIVVLNLLCGLRVSEACKMDWSLINLEKGRIIVTVVISKVNERRVVNINKNALAWLRLAAENGCRLPVPQATYYKYKIRKRLNEENKMEPVIPPFGKNVLRHSFCSYHYAKWKNIGLTSDMAGNSPEIIKKDYKACVEDEDANDFWEITP